ncbi:hypothetical protein ACO1O0_001170 [Amphichorda felina]
MASSNPRFFIVRSSTFDGDDISHQPNIVPLIPADLLPKWIEIQGVPRQLTLDQTAGMTNLGSFAAAGDEVLCLRFLNVYQGDGPAQVGDCEDRGRPSTTTASSGGGEGVQSIGEAPSATPPRGTTTSSSKTSPPKQPVLSPSQHGRDIGTPSSGSSLNISRPGLASSQHNLGNSPSSAASPPEPAQGQPLPPGATTNPDVPPKYCQEWCHHGTCSRGDCCPRRHDMPQTRHGLAEVGLVNFPPWYPGACFKRPLGANKKKGKNNKKKKTTVTMEAKKPLRGAGAGLRVKERSGLGQRDEGTDLDWGTQMERAMEELKLGREVVLREKAGESEARRGLVSGAGEPLIDLW